MIKTGKVVSSFVRRPTTLAEKQYERDRGEWASAAAEAKKSREIANRASRVTSHGGKVLGAIHGDFTGVVGAAVAPTVAKPIGTFIADAHHVASSSRYKGMTFKDGVRLAEDNDSKCHVM